MATHGKSAIRCAVLGVVFLFGMRDLVAGDYEREPIQYAKAKADNVVSRLQDQIAKGKAPFTFEEDRGYLKSLLQALKVPESSQVFVYSKSSLQRERISPKTPRALYFNDDVYVGFCLRGDVLELSAVDPNLGTVFYTLAQQPNGKPKITRHNDNCLICHGSSLTRNVPGHIVRSLHVDREGYPNLGAGSYRIDQSSPFKERWGGWYVTGTHGKQTHMGNRFVTTVREADERPFNPEGQNVKQLKDWFTTGFYLTPHSDLIALMVMEHQAEMHNRIARATLETRSALHYQAELNKVLGTPDTHRSDSTTSRIKGVAEDLVKYMLFHEETVLEEPIAGTSSFTEDFPKQGPRDRKGRSLRDFDLKTRMFRYPCSYLIYSDAFHGMPSEVKDVVYRRLHDVLTAKTPDKTFARLSTADRGAILEILVETKTDLPSYWKTR